MPAAAAYERIQGQLEGYIRREEQMSRHTTYRIGGPAALFVECDSVNDLALVLGVLGEEQVEWTALGRGSNVLVSDEGYDGAVIVLGRDFKRHGTDSDGYLTAGAGVSLAALVQEAFSLGMTGMEFAVGIPGTFGGALVMNAGTRDEWVGERVESVTVFTSAGLDRVRGSEVDWGYRSTDLPERGVVVEACLQLKPGDEWQIRASMEASLRRRKRNQPLGLPNAGSVFRNPEGGSAGQLIESVGLKGRRVGGAQISELHANFIVNTGGASAADVVALVRLARELVEEEHGIQLKPEIRFLGAFESA